MKKIHRAFLISAIILIITICFLFQFVEGNEKISKEEIITEAGAEETAYSNEDSDLDVLETESFLYEEITTEQDDEESRYNDEYEYTDTDLEEVEDEECDHNYIKEHVEACEDIPYCHIEEICGKCGNTIVHTEDISDQCPVELDEDECDHNYLIIHGEEEYCTDYCCYITEICEKCGDTIHSETEPDPLCANRKENK